MNKNKKYKLGPGEKIPLSFDEAARIMFTNPNRMEPLNFIKKLKEILVFFHLGKIICKLVIKKLNVILS